MTLIRSSSSCSPVAPQAPFVREDPGPFQITDRDISSCGSCRASLLALDPSLRARRGAAQEGLRPADFLFHAGYLDRPRAQFDHYREGGGSSPIVYGLGNRGADCWSTASAPIGRVGLGAQERLAGRQFIQHTLAIADVRVALTTRHPAAGLSAAGARGAAGAAPIETRAAKRPWTLRAKRATQRQHASNWGRSRPCVRHPLSRGRFRASVVECDRGTMPVDRANLLQTSLKRSSWPTPPPSPGRLA